MGPYIYIYTYFSLSVYIYIYIYFHFHLRCMMDRSFSIARRSKNESQRIAIVVSKQLCPHFASLICSQGPLRKLPTKLRPRRAPRQTRNHGRLHQMRCSLDRQDGTAVAMRNLSVMCMAKPKKLFHCPLPLAFAEPFLPRRPCKRSSVLPVSFSAKVARLGPIVLRYSVLVAFPITAKQ